MKFFKKAKTVSEYQRPDAAALATRAQLDAAEGISDAGALDPFGLMKALVVYRQEPIARELSSIGRRYSMLHPDVLILLYYLASHTTNELLEIGPYIGGSTIAAANGLRDAGRQRTFVTVENGGSYDHPTLPSRNIVADLRKNLAANQVDNLVQIIVGSAAANEIANAVHAQLRSASVGMFTMDADGAIEEALTSFRTLLAPACWLVIDDYYAKAAVALTKASRTRKQVDSLVLRGELEVFGVFGWGTWIGRWRGGREGSLPNE